MRSWTSAHATEGLDVSKALLREVQADEIVGTTKSPLCSLVDL